MATRLAWLTLGILATASCSVDGTNHDLIGLTGITPSVVEAGDTVQITGQGFPEGSPARVAFRGDVFRAGQAAQHGIEIVVRTRDTAKDTISFVVNDELERAFSGAAGVGSHAAFRGTVTLAFASRPGSFAPVTGTLHNVTLEVVPRATAASAARGVEQQARDALTFLGLGLTDEGATDCCVVASSEGRALIAGVQSGDRIVQFDGIPVRSIADLIPAGRNRTATLWIRRDNSQPPVMRSVDVQGFRWAVPSELAPSLWGVVFVVGILIALASPLRRALSVAVRVAKKKSMSSPVHPLRSACHRGIALIRSHASDLPMHESAGFRIAQVFSVMGLSGLCAMMATREELLSGELDLILWWLLSTLSVSAATWVHSTWCLGNRLATGALHAAQILLHQLPVLILILVSAVINGSPRITEIVRMQGPWPNSWLFFRDPAFMALGLVAMGTLVPLSDGMVAPTRSAQSIPRRATTASAAALLSFLTSRLHLWLQAILFAVLLFGGWSMDHEPLLQRHGIGVILPTLLLLAKAWAITAVLIGVRALCREIRFRHTTRWTLRYGLPLSLVLGGVSLSWAWGLQRWSVNWADTAIRWALLSVSLAWFAVVAVRARGGLHKAQSSGLENRWV